MYCTHVYTFACQANLHKDAVLQSRNKPARTHTLMLTRSRLERYCFTAASRGQTSHTGNEKQKSQIWMEFWGNEGQSSLAAAGPQTIPPGTQLRSLGDWHKA